MSIFQVSDTWKMTYPDAHAGVLIMREAANPAQHAVLEKHKEALEEELRSRFSGQDRAALYIVEIIGAIILTLGYVAGLYVAAVSLVGLLTFMITGAWLLLIGVYADREQHKNDT